jgi:hypothetical protein
MPVPYVRWDERRRLKKQKKAQTRRESGRRRKATQRIERTEARKAREEIGELPYAGVKSLQEIADDLGVSLRTVSADYFSAVRKLREQPGAFSIVLAWIHACEEMRHPRIRCGSVECRREYIELYRE